MNQKLKKKIKTILQNPNLDTETVQKFEKRLKQGKLTRDQNTRSHFCVFFLPFSEKTKRIFIGDHIKAGTWISPGGHIDDGEIPEETVIREFKEELKVSIKRNQVKKPFCLTIKNIDNPRHNCKKHYDIWYLIKTDEKNFNYSKKEFKQAKWVTITEAEKILTDKTNIKAIRILKKMKI